MSDVNNLVTLSLKHPKNTNITPELTQAFLATLININHLSNFKRLFGNTPPAVSLEILLSNQQIKFQLTCDKALSDFIQTQIQSVYPLVIIQKEKTLFPGEEDKQLITAKFTLNKGYYYPLATYSDFRENDPLTSLLSILSKGRPSEKTLIQLSFESVSNKWVGAIENYANHGVKNADGTYQRRPDANIIHEKTLFSGFRVSFRVATNEALTLSEISRALSIYSRPDGNSYKMEKRKLFKKNLYKEILNRQVTGNDILNIKEMATLWHLPSEKVKTSSIVWGTNVLSEAPDDLPVATNITPEEKMNVNYFAKTIYKNEESIFGIKTYDRRKHLWCIGKTGTGKSTFIANMVIDDLKKGRGVAVVDPHGDLCELLLDYIPSHRINDTIYFNPADKEYPITINPLEVSTKEEAELVVSGLMSIFTKVWANVWSSRMEYILRNTFLTLAEVPHSTLEDVLKILANQNVREEVIKNLKDEALIHFWREEFDKMPENLQKEAIAPIQNKVGQFVTSPLIRRIIGNPKSSISIDDAMNSGKIILCNLSQGRLGEDNANLLGAMLISKMQLSAMHRVDIPEEQRRDFFLYVDEFQNFATDSFIKILSEARKYRLCLTLANQYMAQIPEFVRKAILGNAATIVSFAVGAEDASILEREFAGVFSHNDLVNLSNYQVAMKLSINGRSSSPFVATTLPLPFSKNNNKEKVIINSKQRFGTKSWL